MKIVQLDKNIISNRYDLNVVAVAQTEEARAIDLSDDERLILVADKAGGLKLINI